MRIDETDRPKLGALHEDRALRSPEAVSRWPDKQRIERVTLRRPHPRLDAVDRQTLNDQAHRNEHDRYGILHEHGLHTPGPQRGPQRQRRRKSARGKQAPHIATLVARPVVPEHDEPKEQRRRILPTVDHSGGKRRMQTSGDRTAQQLVVPHGAHQRPNCAERHHVARDQHRESDRGPS